MERAGTFYARSAIPGVDRFRGAGSMVFSRLFGNGHVWDPLLHGPLQALNGSMQSLEVHCSQLARHSCGSLQ